MSEKEQDKTKLPKEDAEVELTEDDLSKVSGGWVYQDIAWVRTPTVREKQNPTGFKVEIQG